MNDKIACTNPLCRSEEVRMVQITKAGIQKMFCSCLMCNRQFFLHE